MRKTTMPDPNAASRTILPHFSAFSHWRELGGIGLFIVWHWQMLNVFRYAKEAAFPLAPHAQERPAEGKSGNVSLKPVIGI